MNERERFEFAQRIIAERNEKTRLRRVAKYPPKPPKPPKAPKVGKPHLHPLPRHELPEELTREQKAEAARAYLAKGYSQKQTAAIFGVSPPAVSNWLHGTAYKWRERNKDRQKAYKKKHRRSPKGRVNENIRKRLKKVVERGLAHRRDGKIGAFSSVVGCSPRELVEWIEDQWEPGMSWDNYGEWHIDHISPVSKGIDQPAINCFLNLQPLWAEDNVKKADSTT